MFGKKILSAVISTALASSIVGSIGINADITANPVISRNCPAYTSSSSAASGCDDFYYTFWSGTSNDYLAYDLSGTPAAQRKKVIAAWYNATGQYDYTVVDQSSNGMPTDYTIEVNKAAGGSYPESGWETVDTVSGNTLHSRQHLIDMQGYNWIRMSIKKVDGKESGSCQINFDIHNVSDGVTDSWIFFGDSITAGGMMNCYGTSFAEYVNRLDSRYYPVQENGGIGGIFSTDGRNNIDRWIKTYPGKYVSIAYGTNDAWGNQTGAQKYYENTAYMVEKVLEMGKTPVVPKIPYSTEKGVNTYLDDYNKMVDKIYENYPSVVKGPDFDEYFRKNPDMLSGDGVHPSFEGYEEMRKLWAETMYKNVYTSLSDEPVSSAVKGDVNADGKVDNKDVKLLSEYLVKKSALKSAVSADMDDNGKVTVADLLILKRTVAPKAEATGEVKLSSFDATEDNAKLVGRNVIKNGTTWLVQSGSSAEFLVSGETAEVVLSGDSGVNSDPDYRPRYAVYVDDKLITDKTMDKREEKVELFSGSTSVTKKVKVIMLSEAMYGAIGVNSINVKSGVKTPVKPTPKKDLCIEFIGDSITCAYGVEGKSNGDPFKTTTENFTKSYAYLTAQKLGADYDVVSYSGHGIISGYTSGEKNTDSLIPPCYDVASKQSGYAEKWDLDKRKNDVVVINLGTNDSSYITGDGKAHLEERAKEFVNGYVDFLKTVREKNSNAYIICTLGTMDFENIYEYVDKAVGEYKAETKDSRIMFYQSVQQNAADGYGSDWHPSETTQKNISYVLADKICTALGMESDQVGLDVAADAEYNLETNSASGASAWPYVGYDKSFNINISAGGKTAEDIKAVISGIAIKKNGEYRLEFDYSVGGKIDMTVNVSGNGKYFADKITTKTEKTHYSDTFKCTADDKNAKIEFLLGGQGNCNMTLSNIKLIKIAYTK